MPWSGASSALTSCPLVSFVVKPLSQRRTPSYTNQDVFPRSAAASNRHFKRGIRGPVRASEPQSPCFPVPPTSHLPVPANNLPCYAENISLLLTCSACTPIFAQPTVIKTKFPARTGPGAASSPCFSPVIREYQGELGRHAPSNPGSTLPSSLPRQARMEPRRLQMCACGLRFPRG